MATAMAGGIRPVEGSGNTVEIENLAKFAVDDHNNKENVVLEFARVVNAKQQAVAGILYYITLEARDGDRIRVYETKVWVKPWMNFREVQEFRQVGDGPATGGCSS